MIGSGEQKATCPTNGSSPRTSARFSESSSPHYPWQMNTTTIKQESLMHEERNDSGITSGSEYNSSPSGSDSSQDMAAVYSLSNPLYINRSLFNSMPSMHGGEQSSSVLQYNLAMQQMQQIYGGHSVLTPPNSEPLTSPKSSQSDFDNTIRPSSSSPPPNINNDNNTEQTDNDNSMDNDDHLKRLQLSVEQNGFYPTNGNTSENSMDVDNKSEDEADDQGIRTPKVNSHGRLKKFKCKSCDFVALTKIDYWYHIRIHIKEEKRLDCPKCPFVTEYKHHLEYHINNHDKKRPFKCSECEYTCANRSMLNSHAKSHSSIYQYRCRDCGYNTKYVHSLKLHLRKYTHEPAMVLNPDGTPNPFPVIDIYGTRRGPKMKYSYNKDGTKIMQPIKQQSQVEPSTPPPPPLPPAASSSSSSSSQQPQPSVVPQFPLPQSEQQLPFPAAEQLPGLFLMAQRVQQNLINMQCGLTPPNPELLQELFQQRQALAQQIVFYQQLQKDYLNGEQRQDEEQDIKQEQQDDQQEHHDDNDEQSEGVLDLSRQNEGTSRNRRKAPPCKLDNLKAASIDDEEDDDDNEEDAYEHDDDTTTMFSNVEVVQNHQEDSEKPNSTKSDDSGTNNNNNNNNNNNSRCQYCEISFENPVLYTVHMGYHGYKNPFTCNMCGKDCDNAVNFFVHIGREAHI